MKKKFLILIGLLLTVSCGQTPQAVTLQENQWAPAVREALNELLASHGKGSYAVFDFDQTSIVHDISQALWVYQIEHLRYADAPAHDFLDGIPNPEEEIPGTALTFAGMGRILSAEYRDLKARLDAGEPLGAIRQSEGFLDFRARMHSFILEIDNHFGSSVSYLWQPGLLAGYTQEEARALIQDAVAEELGREKLDVERGRSADRRWGGEVVRGIWVSPEMKDLYHCLEAAGIDTYVCSASLEPIVEVLACDPELGFGLPPERVFGLRFVPGDTIIPTFDPQYKQPHREGKVDCIKAYIAPAYGDAAPILVAGDSNGDVPMLTSFPDLVHGLVIDVGRSPDSAIGQLALRAREEKNLGLYLVQPSFEQ